MLEAVAEVTVKGLLLAVVSAFFNGTFPMFGKLLKEEPNPIIFNTMLCLGVFVSSMLVIPFFPLVPHSHSEGFPLGWSWPGAAAGSLLVGATLFSFIAIPLCGLATGSATWSVSAILVAFLWGAIGPEGIGQKSSSLPLAIVAIVIIVLGALILNTRDQLADMLPSRCHSATLELTGSDICSNHVPQEQGEQLPTSSSGSKTVLGLMSAVTVGLFGGSILVPAHYVRAELGGLPLLPSFGCGAAVVGICVGLFYWVAIKRESLSLRSGSPLAHELRREVVVFGMLSGLLWNISNIAQILAMNYFHMPYGVSYPILQCGLLVAGVWGIYVFKEVKETKPKLIFWLGAFVLMIGVGMLGLFGPGTYKESAPPMPPMSHPLTASLVV